VQTLDKNVSKGIIFRDPCQKNLKQLPSSPCCFWTCNVPTIHYSFPAANFGTVPCISLHGIISQRRKSWATFCLMIIWVDNRREQLLFLSVPLAFRPLCCVKETDCRSSLPAVTVGSKQAIPAALGAADLGHVDGRSKFLRIVGSIAHCRTVQKPPGRINN